MTDTAPLGGKAILKLLAGRKTYLTLCVLGLLLFGSWQKWWVLPAEVYQGLMALALAFIKAGISRELREVAQVPNDVTSTIGATAAPADGAAAAPVSIPPQ